MSAVEWGDKIAVTGKPAWLAGDVSMRWVKPDGAFNREGGPCLVREHNWHSYVHTPNTATVAIRLPADHFAYTAIAKGFEPWGGNDSAPVDWDKGRVLARDGEDMEIGENSRWLHIGRGGDVIGYHKRQSIGSVIFASAYATDATHVSIKRMTSDEAAKWMADRCIHSSAYREVLEALGLIREPTKAEQIATKTGLTTDQVQSVLDAMEDN